MALSVRMRIGARGAMAWGSMRKRWSCFRAPSISSSGGLQHFGKGAEPLRPRPLRHAARQSDDRRRVQPRSSISTIAASPGISMTARPRCPSSNIGPDVPALVDAWVKGYRKVLALAGRGCRGDSDLHHVSPDGCSSPGSARMRRPISPSRWGFPIPGTRSPWRRPI